MSNDHPPTPPAAPPLSSATHDADPHQLRHIPREIFLTFVRWIGIGAIVGAVALGLAGLWYFGLIGLMVGAVLGVIVGGVAGLLLLFQLNWPF